MQPQPDPIMTPLVSAEMACDANGFAWTFYGPQGAVSSTATTMDDALSALARECLNAAPGHRLSIVFAAECLSSLVSDAISR